MDDAANVAGNLITIVLLSVWWALLSMAPFSGSREAGKAERKGAGTQDAETPAAGAGPVLAGLRELDPQFDMEAFLGGARRAYETIVQAYALGDMEALRPLLSAEVLKAFADVRAARGERRETLDLSLVGIDSAEIASVEIGDEAVEVAVVFRAQIISVERSPAGAVIRGDPAAVVATADLWTFSRALPAKGAAWTLIATDEAAESP